MCLPLPNKFFRQSGDLFPHVKLDLQIFFFSSHQAIHCYSQMGLFFNTLLTSLTKPMDAIV